MGFRRGFKSEAEALATELRAELGLCPLDRLDPWRLAAHLEIPIMKLSELSRDAAHGVYYFSSVEPESFSAITVFDGSRRMIVHNDAHAPSRQANDVTHELAHGVLLHHPTPALDRRGCRNWNQDREDEADFLAGALLITQAAALRIAQKGIALEIAADAYGVSRRMVQYRLNVTGAYKRVQRARARRQYL